MGKNPNAARLKKDHRQGAGKKGGNYDEDEGEGDE